MKHLSIFKAVALFSAVIFLQAFSATGAEAYTACTFNSDNQITDDMSNYGECDADPTHRKILAYKVGLCTELPYDTNYKQVCDFIYDKTTPIELEAIKGASVSVAGFGEITLTEGTEYTHTVVLISNTTYVKSLFSFPSDRQGASGTGRWCWSNGGGVTTKDRTADPMTLKSKFTAECGSEAEANPQYNYETNNAFGSAVDGERHLPAVVRNFPTWAAEESYTNRGQINILMSDEDTKAVFETTPLSWDTPNTKSVYWLAGRSINPSVSVDGNKSNLDLKLKVSWGSVVWYSGVANTGDGEGNWHTDCDTTPCVGRIRIGGFDVNVGVK